MNRGLVNVNFGRTPQPEQETIEEVRVYGRRRCRIGDALEVLIDHVKLEGLSRQEADALAILKGQLAEVRKVKQRERERPE